MTAREWLAGHRPRTRYVRLRAELDALDRGLVETGLIAARALERVEAQDEVARRRGLRVVPDGER